MDIYWNAGLTMSQILAISDSIENTRYDVSRKVATFKDYGLEPVLAVPEIINGDGSQKTDIGGILDYCFEECTPSCIAIRIIRDAAAVKLVADKLATNEHNAVIAEISLISRSGEVLVSADTYEAVISCLMPQVQFISINTFEAELLSQITCSNSADLEKAAEAIFAQYSCIVYINGSEKSSGRDLLYFGGNSRWLPAIDASRRPPKDRSLMASIACELTFDKTIIDAVDSARKFYAGEFNPAPEAKAVNDVKPEQPSAPVQSLVSPAKSIRDIAPKKIIGAEPAVTSVIEEPAPGPKGMVSELKESESKPAGESLSELQALKARMKKISEM